MLQWNEAPAASGEPKMSPSNHSIPLRGPHPAPLVEGSRRAPAPVVGRGALMVVGALVGAMTMALAVVAGPVTAQAGFDCEAPVVDTSGTLDRAAVLAVMDDIEFDLVGPEARVVVRVWDQAPSIDLVTAVDELVDRCFDDGEGGIDDQVAILSVTTSDLALDVLLGARWARSLQADRLQADIMTPALRQGDVTEAMTAALGEMAELVASPDPAGGDGGAIPGPEAGPEPGQGDTGDPVGQGGQGEQGDATGSGEAQPGSPEEDGIDRAGDDDADGEGERSETRTGDGDGDRDPGPVAMLWGLVGLTACAGAVLLVGRWRQLDRRRTRLIRQIDPIRSRLLVTLDRDDRLRRAGEGWYRTGAGRTRTVVGGELRRAESGRGAVERPAIPLWQVMGDGIDRADRDRIERIGELGNDLSQALSGHEESLDRLATLGAHLDHLRVALPTKADLLAREVPEVRDAVNRHSGRGRPIDGLRAELAKIQAAVDEVHQAATDAEVDLLGLSEDLGRAEVSLFAAAHEVDAQLGRETSLTRRLDRLAEASDHEMNRVDDLRRQLAAAARVHAPASWRWAADHPERATEAVDRAIDLQSEAADVAIPARRFDEAGRLLHRAGVELIGADDLLNEVDDLLIDLDRARSEAPIALAESRRAVAELAAMLAQRPGTAPSALIHRRDELADLVAALDDELVRAKPDHRRVVETAEELGAEMDELILTADAPDLVAGALGREQQRQVARAHRAVARARRSLSWQLLASADGAILDRLDSRLTDLPVDPRAGAEAAADITDDALRAQERIIARRRRAVTGVTGGTVAAMGVHNGWVIGSAPGNRSNGGAGGAAVAGAGPIRSRDRRSFGGRLRSGT